MAERFDAIIIGTGQSGVPSVNIIEPHFLSIITISFKPPFSRNDDAVHRRTEMQ